nr:hypothetical protein [Spirochaetaceae bacterium]
VNNSESLSLKIKNALDLFQKDDQILYDIRKNAVNLINANYTWEKVFVAGYLPLYKKITSK